MDKTKRFVVMPASHDLWEAAGIHVTVSDVQEKKHIAFCRDKTDADDICRWLNMHEEGELK